MPGGRRNLQEEKPFLTELGRIFHLVKAQFRERAHRQQRQQKQGSQPTAKHTDPAHLTSPASGRSRKRHTRRGSARQSHGGGSIWITFKGGFATRHVPAPSQSKRAERKAAARVALSIKKRYQALQSAEAFVQSAWQQAAEADLLQLPLPVNSLASAQPTAHTRSKAHTSVRVSNLAPLSGLELMRSATPNEEGAQYLAEQYEIAASMLCLAPVGSHVRMLLETVSAAATQLRGGHAHSDAAKKERRNNNTNNNDINDNRTMGSESARSASSRAVLALHQPQIQEMLWREYVIRHTLYGPHAEAQARAACAAEVSTADAINEEEAETTRDQCHRVTESNRRNDGGNADCAENYYFVLSEPVQTAATMSGGSSSSVAGEMLRNEEDMLESKASQQQQPQGADCKDAEAVMRAEMDILPSKCIVRVRSSQRVKQTTILSKVKDINHFVSNFSQVMRKELATSRLPRQPAGEENMGSVRASGGVATRHHGGLGDGHRSSSAGGAVHRGGKATGERHNHRRRR